MAVRIPPPPIATEDKSLWNNWYIAVQSAVAASFKWTQLDFTGSTLASVQVKSHQVLDSLQGGSTTERYHLTAAQVTSVTGLGTAASQSGLTVVITTAAVTGTGATGSMTFTNGVLTDQLQAT